VKRGKYRPGRKSGKLLLPLYEGCTKGRLRVKDEIVDLASLRNALKYIVVSDWDTFALLAKHLMERYNLRVNPWENFE